MGLFLSLEHEQEAKTRKDGILKNQEVRSNVFGVVEGLLNSTAGGQTKRSDYSI